MLEPLVPGYGNLGIELQIHNVSDAYRAVWFIFDKLYLRRIGATPPDVVPVAHINLAVNGDPDMIGHVILPHIQYVLQLTGHTRLGRQ